MFGTDKERAVIFGEYTVTNKATVRATAAAFGVSKSTVHKDLTEYLPKISSGLYAEVRKILEESGVAVTVRRTLGSDIDAACGQLRASRQ